MEALKKEQNFYEENNQKNNKNNKDNFFKIIFKKICDEFKKIYETDSSLSLTNLKTINASNILRIALKGFIRIIPFAVLILILYQIHFYTIGFVHNNNIYEYNSAAAQQILPSAWTETALPFMMLFASFIFLFKGKGRIIYLFTISIISTGFAIYDVWYYRGFNTFPSVLALLQAGNIDSNMSDSIQAMISKADIIFFKNFIWLIIAAIIFRKFFSKKDKRAWKTFILVFAASLGLFIKYPLNLYILNKGDTDNGFVCRDVTNTQLYFSELGYHSYDLINSYISSRPYTLTDEDIKNKNEFFNLKNENLPDNEYFGAAKGKNLIYIQVESFEDFVLNQEFNGQEITPNINKILKDSVYFPNIYEQVWEGTSSDCDFMINTGIMPVKSASTFFRYPYNNYNSMPKILAANGYATEVIHPDEGNFWNYKKCLTGGIGFENFIDVNSFDASDSFGMGLSDESYFAQAVPMIKELKEPFYAMTVTLSNHVPFNLPEDRRELEMDDECNKNRLGGHFQSIHYTDKHLGSFLENLKNEGLLENSIVVITGDHGGAHKYLLEDINSFPQQEEWFQGDERRVPFIIYDPSGEITPAKFDTVGGQIDLMPTMLYLLGISKDEYENTCIGRNLLNTEMSYAFYPSGSCIKGGENLTDEEKQIIMKTWDISDKEIRSTK